MSLGIILLLHSFNRRIGNVFSWALDQSTLTNWNSQSQVRVPYNGMGLISKLNMVDCSDNIFVIIAHYDRVDEKLPS